MSKACLQIYRDDNFADVQGCVKYNNIQREKANFGRGFMVKNKMYKLFEKNPSN